MSLRAFFKTVPFRYVAPGVVKSKPREDLTCAALRFYFKGQPVEEFLAITFKEMEVAIL
jgi:hypothetical protein